MNKILLTNHHLVNYAGSELVTLELATEFQQRGWKVTVATFKLGAELERIFKNRGIKVCNILREPLPEREFDIIWSHHYPILIKCLIDDSVKTKFLILSSLSPYEPLEAVPFFHSQANLILCNSEETKQEVKTYVGCYQEKLFVFKNSVPSHWFNIILNKINSQLNNIAVISNHPPIEIVDAIYIFKSQKINVDLIGISGIRQLVNTELLSSYDAVITIGRTVQHAMSLGIPVFCYDHFGGPGWLTPDNFKRAEWFNYSGRCCLQKLTGKHLVHKLIKRFDESKNHINFFKDYAVENYSLSTNIDAVLSFINYKPQDSRNYIDFNSQGFIGKIGQVYRRLLIESVDLRERLEQSQLLPSNEFTPTREYQNLSFQLLDHDFASIPEWLLFDYLQLLSSQGYFQEVGEAEKYCKDIEKLIDSLHKFISNNKDSDLYRKLINYFAQSAKFIPLYFNDFNLKNIYVKRAEIIEHFLKLKGLETDYQFTDRPVNRKKIRLGILATDFTPSAETFAYLPVYEYLSRNFEVILYPLAETGEPLEQYCQLSANLFKPLPQELSQQVKTIRDDDLDILFIATNVTISTNQFCLLAAHRLARIQVTSGGSVVTTGMRNMDYYISGTLTDPSPTAQEQYQEKLIKLEGSAHCFSYGTEEGKITTPVERNDLGIPEDAVVFTSCANYFKIIPELIETWAKIINQVPNSVLVLFPFGPNWARNYPKTQFINHLNSIFINYGLAPERLIVLDPQPVPDRQDMKEYYKIADVYLDSFPFAGTTSLVEPLEVNLPVIARQGNCFRSAMGAAMILTLNIPDLVADTEESYIKLAVILGNHPELRQQKSDEIKAVMNNNPGFLDSRSYSAKMGNLFQELFRNYLAENLAENLHLRQLNFIIFPDWTQSEDELGFELQQVIQTLATHPDNEKITLIIYTGNIANEDAEMFLSSVAMNLLMEDLDISDTIDISLLGMLGDMQWQSLLPRIYGRIILDNEDKVALAQGQVNKLDCYPLDSLINQI